MQDLVIHSSSDWPAVEAELKRRLKTIGYNGDLERMFKNLCREITTLSKLEVDARRTRDVRLSSEQLTKINSILTTLEQWMIIAALSA